MTVLVRDDLEHLGSAGVMVDEEACICVEVGTSHVDDGGGDIDTDGVPRPTLTTAVCSVPVVPAVCLTAFESAFWKTMPTMGGHGG